MPPALHHAGLIALGVLAVIAIFVAIVTAIVEKKRVRELYAQHFGSNVPRERLLISSASFYVSFALVRVITHAIHAGRGSFHDVSMGGRHIHHLVWGILLLLLVGYCWLWQAGRRSRALGRVLAFLYGVGAALTLDEYALWLNLQDVYWEREGRASIDAVLLFSALLTMGFVGGRFLHALSREAVRTLRRA